MNLLKALATVGGMTFISRLLGFVRDTLIARIFGAGMATDAFFVAFKIPNLLRRISGEGAFSQAFVPILSEYRKQRTPEATKALINHVSSLLGLFLVAITIVGMLAAPLIVRLTSPGFVGDQAKFALTTDLLRITFPYILFISLVSMAGGVLNAHSKFQVPAFTPVWLNLSFITAALFVAPHFNNSVYVLAWAVFVGGIIQLLYQLPSLQKIGMLPRYALNIQDEGVRRILKLMGPAIFGVSVAQISIVLNNVFASFMPTGSVSWLYYADRLMEFPTGVLGVALGTILLPSLSKAHVDKSPAEFSQLLDWGLRLTFMLAIPAAVAMAVLSKPLVASLFYYGKFTEIDVAQTERALIAYSLSLLGLIMVKVLAPGFYARQNVRTPVKIAIFTLVMTQILNVLFLYFTPLRHAGLALAVGLGACLNATLLWVTLQRTGAFVPNKGWLAFLAKLLLAVTVMAVGLHFVATWSGDWLSMPVLPRLMHLAGVVVLGIAVYFAMLGILGFRPRDFSRRVVN
ncbi:MULTISPECIES: murein biosynthesis integral membrane protein MurJ [unclassified Methylophilus]|uniref:murein biosynthesis integral membrane protein MurJ n=1 Tax=unclassified Methylophilus TaxID=2630143 RepID=UPI0006F4AB6E|nr:MULTISPECIES: murein biosynthesis integral membrane protein MurJ [unclassified Methylophilus]KQT43915.1 murein biosynthesis protein MurJ [Methylophilus sp. Leaf416]KQT59399.1 murein biosynthesis protein MurJ [Methylophilus sp. Leaf459]